MGAVAAQPLYLAAQLVVLPGALVFLYRRSRPHYERLRNTILATWVLSIPIYAAFPVAPPRLADSGLVDTITTQTGVALDSSLTTSFYNELAAVPSLHVGFAVAGATETACDPRCGKPHRGVAVPLPALSRHPAVAAGLCPYLRCMLVAAPLPSRCSPRHPRRAVRSSASSSSPTSSTAPPGSSPSATSASPRRNADWIMDLQHDLGVGVEALRADTP